jgi:ATP-binding cassette, subfamily F, member 3
MSLLVISGATIRIAGRTLLDSADLTIDPGRRIGLVGRNGAGKSTLLRAIMGDLALDGGELRFARGIRVATVRQEAPEGPATLLDTVLEGDAERLALLKEADHADPLRLAEIHDRLLAIGADSAPARAAAILAGLGFDEAAQARPVSSYSGGWMSRPTISTSKRPCGWKPGSRASRARRWWSPTIAACWTEPWRRSRILIKASCP